MGRKARRSVSGERKHTDLPRPQIVVRKPKLRLDPQRAKRWMNGGARTLILHALSTTFPGGERFFIKSVMAYKDRITDPQLLEEIRLFAAQEAAHTRAHVRYDDAGQRHYDVKRIEALVERDLAFAFRWLSGTRKRWWNGPRSARAGTVALEHVTATLARRVLTDERIFDGVEPEFARLWSWHAAEEIEHKAVAYDVFEAVGGTYAERAMAMLAMGPLLAFDTLRMVAGFLRGDGQAWSPAAWADVLGFLFVAPGALRRAAPDFAAYFRPSFHPWDQDDRALLERWRGFSDAVAEPVSAAG